METEDFASLIDSLIICRFIRGVWKWRGMESFKERYEGLAKFYTLTTGIEVNSNDMRRAGERITNLKKLFNIREGWKMEDDTLPHRIMCDPIPSGPYRGSRIAPEELESFLRRYYEARGWDVKTGIPTVEKIMQLELTEEGSKIVKQECGKVNHEKSDIL